jgi:hypothetical protein
MPDDILDPRNGFQRMLDLVYERATHIARLASSDLRKGWEKKDPVSRRRFVTLISLLLVFMVFLFKLLFPLIGTIADDYSLRRHVNEIWKPAYQLANTPQEKAALRVLWVCVRHQESFRRSYGLPVDPGFAAHDDEQFCVSDTVAQALLFGGPAKAQEVHAIYDRLGFKLDPK